MEEYPKWLISDEELAEMINALADEQLKNSIDTLESELAKIISKKEVPE
ncbi:hypothetical protein [Liquorilactobacillus mali]|nr:hypothetical protein [Liquorilactobacillus mali]MDC7953579.1 hypothetical protein [Liquorilactobacillus mali]